MADLGLEQMVEELLTETKKQDTDTEEDFETHFLAPAHLRLGSSIICLKN